MASESDSGYSVSATPVSSASPAINHHSREATHSPQGGGLINLDEADLEGDTEAGPDINDDEFKSANEIFKDPSSFDFLSQVHIAASCFFSATSLLWGGNNSRFRGQKVFELKNTRLFSLMSIVRKIIIPWKYLTFVMKINMR